MKNKFEKQLSALLESEIDKLPEGEDGEDGNEETHEELLPVVFDEKESSISIESNPDLEEDYKFARSNYYGLIGRTNAAIDLIMKIAAMSEHPRAMEVAANLMKTSADVTKDLLALQKSLEQKNPSNNKTPPPGKYEQHNHYYGDKSPKAIDEELDGLDDENKK